MSDRGEVDAAAGRPKDVVEIVEPYLTALPPEKKKEALRIISQSIRYQGPLPPPEMMAAYGAVIDDGPNRLMRLLEKQTDHRIAMESQLVGAKVGTTKLGQYFAAGLSVFFGLIALFLGYTGHDWLAGTICVSTITGLAAVFILGKAPNNNKSADAPKSDATEVDAAKKTSAKRRKPSA